MLGLEELPKEEYEKYLYLKYSELKKVREEVRVSMLDYEKEVTGFDEPIMRFFPNPEIMYSTELIELAAILIATEYKYRHICIYRNMDKELFDKLKKEILELVKDIPELSYFQIVEYNSEYAVVLDILIELGDISYSNEKDTGKWRIRKKLRRLMN